MWMKGPVCEGGRSMPGPGPKHYGAGVMTLGGDGSCSRQRSGEGGHGSRAAGEATRRLCSS